MSITGFDLIFNRADLAQTETIDAAHPDQPAEGEVLLRIDQFALTANNVTYAIAPDEIGYWNFFPADRDGWGRVPVWGFAEAIASNHPDVPVGSRVYGYFPMSTHLVVRPGKVTPGGFSDTTEHRQSMAPIYNAYAFTNADPAYAPDREGLISLFRPLFTTSFLLDDLHRSENAFGAQRVLLSSASSKTALGMAFLLDRDRIGDVEIVGLTSPGNRAFVESLRFYDKVCDYSEVETLDRRPTAFVDMAGDADLLRRVHAHFDETLTNSCRVGLTHWQSTSNWIDGLRGGPKPAFFFAPSYAQKRLADWGREGFQERVGAASAAFVADAVRWVRLESAKGPDAVADQWRKMLAGRIDPAAGHVLSMAS